MVSRVTKGSRAHWRKEVEWRERREKKERKNRRRKRVGEEKVGTGKSKRMK